MHRPVCKNVAREGGAGVSFFFKGCLVYVLATYRAASHIGYKVMLHTDCVRRKTPGVTRQLGLNADGHGTRDVTEMTSCH